MPFRNIAFVPSEAEQASMLAGAVLALKTGVAWLKSINKPLTVSYSAAGIVDFETFLVKSG
jgi:hypothetical protein